MSYRKFLTTEDLNHGTIPYRELLRKYETTEFPDSGNDRYSYELYARSELKKKDFDAPFTQADIPNRDPGYSRSKLNERYYGSRGSNNDPRHQEIFLGFMGPDNITSDGQMRLSQFQRQTAARANRYQATMGQNADRQEADRPWSGQSISYDKKKMLDRVRRNSRMFDTSKNGQIRADTRILDPKLTSIRLNETIRHGGESMSDLPYRDLGALQGESTPKRFDTGIGSDTAAWRHVGYDASFANGYRGAPAKRALPDMRGIDTAPWKHVNQDTLFALQYNGMLPGNRVGDMNATAAHAAWHHAVTDSSFGVGYNQQTRAGIVQALDARHAAPWNKMVPDSNMPVHFYGAPPTKGRTAAESGKDARSGMQQMDTTLDPGTVNKSANRQILAATMALAVKTGKAAKSTEASGEFADANTVSKVGAPLLNARRYTADLIEADAEFDDATGGKMAGRGFVDRGPGVTTGGGQARSTRGDGDYTPSIESAVTMARGVKQWSEDPGRPLRAVTQTHIIDIEKEQSRGAPGATPVLMTKHGSASAKVGSMMIGSPTEGLTVRNYTNYAPRKPFDPVTGQVGGVEQRVFKTETDSRNPGMFDERGHKRRGGAAEIPTIVDDPDSLFGSERQVSMGAGSGTGEIGKHVRATSYENGGTLMEGPGEWDEY